MSGLIADAVGSWMAALSHNPVYAGVGVLLGVCVLALAFERGQS